MNRSSRGADLCPRGEVESLNDAVLFDFGGTLDANALTWKERFAQLFADEGVTVPPGRFDPCFYAADDALVGTISSTLPLRDTVRRLAIGVATGLGCHDDRVVERIVERFVSDAGERLAASVALLGTLAARYRLGLVSNFYGNLRAVCDEAGLAPLLDVIVDSTEVGFTKPDPRIFEVALAKLGVPASRAIFVGDSLPRDMAGARAAGMRHVWLAGDPRRPGQPCCAADPVIARLDELERWLE